MHSGRLHCLVSRASVSICQQWWEIFVLQQRYVNPEVMSFTVVSFQRLLTEGVGGFFVLFFFTCMCVCVCFLNFGLKQQMCREGEWFLVLRERLQKQWYSHSQCVRPAYL